MYELIWTVSITLMLGLHVGTVPDTTPFKTTSECEEFAKRMTPRMQDWVRGRFLADWDHEVGIRFRCKIGEPV